MTNEDEVSRMKPELLMEVITSPNFSTTVEGEDCIYFGLKTLDPNTRREQMDFVADILGVRELNERNVVAAEFDLFPFPSHCCNAVLGPNPLEAGQNALHLRNKFCINVAGLVHADGAVLWWPGADVTVRHGDFGFVMRVPQSQRVYEFFEPPLPALDMEKVKLLSDEDSFRETLALTSAQDWATWTGNIPNMGQKVQSTAEDCASPTFQSVTRKASVPQESRFQVQELDLVAAGHASAGGQAILLEKDAFGIPAILLKPLDEAELETLDNMWKNYREEPILRFVPKFEGI
eukprot:CAMPEP_0172695244 /NCGR_PEP_ID=MMETSP1074-20121228/27226_1 /TAXON_ID=2916 /ORGANISM="Ceratium fusus, Strain PA161109" /LENGTH=290 /DNA_ID=CAMNT_0013515841 /DNA_START=92 /DNA_END=961 /DNA_ORIENTATION=-